jgi:hypothetical protein
MVMKGIMGSSPSPRALIQTTHPQWVTEANFAQVDTISSAMERNARAGSAIRYFEEEPDSHTGGGVNALQRQRRTRKPASAFQRTKG